jgi:undecaprenyl-diphosphatase
MGLVQVVVLALIQGVTEFLPISSSAHLILVPWVLGWEDQGLAFDIAVNTGTLVAVIAYFRRDLLDLVRSLVHGLHDEGLRVEGMPARRLLAALAIGTVPVAILGFLAQDLVAGPLRHPGVIGATSIGFGFALLWADLGGRRDRDLAVLTLRDALWIGLAQALALVPGTSRAGITMTAGLALAYTRPAAARFSFLLYIPIGVLAAGKDVVDALNGELPAVSLPPMLVGFAVAAISAYLVIRGLLAWLQRRSLTVFVVYRVLLGLAILGLWWPTR